jgi:hypothetical protein
VVKKVRKFKIILCSLVVFILGTGAVFAQNKTISPDGFWLEIDAASLAGKEPLKKVPPSSFRVFSLDQAAIRAFLKNAPMEFTAEARANPYVITLPMPDGKFARFRIEESPVMEQGLAEKFPEITTYRGYGIDDPTATVRFDLTSSGFHSMVLSAGETVLIDPYAKDDTENYISYFKNDAYRTGEFICDFKEPNKNIFKVEDNFSHPFGEFENVVSGTTLRTYRLALAADFEYCAVFGGTVAGAMTAMTTTMNRVNGVYERDLAIHMNMVANNNLIVYAASSTNCGGGGCTSGTDPYTNTNGSTMLTQNQSNLTTVIGTANYDIGHVFSTGGGGVAVLNGPCTASTKAEGVTGSPSPSGDGYDIDYVAHEMGHQFGANHTFNGTASNCGGGNRSAASAYEPGSGITIMAYAGICGNQDLAAHSIDTFHVKSLEAIVAYSQTGNGNTCDVETPTGNTVPAVSVVGGPSWNIPINTPFALTASATDANGDSITYDWEEYDLGATAGSTVPNTDAGGAMPIFRPYLPSTSGTRYFPSLTYILNNANVPPSTSGSCPAGSCLTGELLPTITRAMTFQVVARDNRANGGGINTATATVNVTATSGPFAVTVPNTNVSWSGNTNQTVTWNVASTTGAPVSAANVKISLSTNGGTTFPTVLIASTPNDGTQSVLIPNSPTTTARIKVEGVSNIFFDISNTNFTITQPTAANVSIGGRVITQNGYGISNARVFLTSTSGEVISAGTNAFGYFLFDNVAAGFYIITAQSKRYRFESSTLQANDNVQDFTIVALPSGLKR